MAVTTGLQLTAYAPSIHATPRPDSHMGESVTSDGSSWLLWTSPVRLPDSRVAALVQRCRTEYMARVSSTAPSSTVLQETHLKYRSHSQI